MFYYHDQKFVSTGGGLEKPTDRDQRSWVFLNDPKKNTLPLTENPQKNTFRKAKPKNTLKNTIHFAKVKHDVIIMGPMIIEALGE